jgi:hypothetical protein
MKKPTINIVKTPDNSLNKSIAAVKEIIEIREGDRGDPEERFVRVKDLLDSGMAVRVVSPGGGISGSFEGSPVSDTSTDPITLDPVSIVADLTIATNFFSVMLTWTYPTYTGHAYTEIYRSSSAATNSGQWLARVYGSMHVDSVDPSSTHYYWVRHVNWNDDEGDFNPSGAGLEGTTSKTVADMLDEASERIAATSLATSLLSSLNSIQYTDTEPTTKQDGRALIAGDKYVKSNKDEYVYTGSSWIKTTIDTSSFVTAANVTTSITEQVGYCTFDSGTGTNFSSVRQAGYTTKSSCLDNNPNANGTYIWHDSGAIAEKADTAFTTANGLSTTVSTNTSSIDGLYGYYQVKIETNGRISGFGLSSSTNPNTLTNESAFIINADKFAIMNPSDTTGGTTTPDDVNMPFIVETVPAHPIKQFSNHKEPLLRSANGAYGVTDTLGNPIYAQNVADIANDDVNEIKVDQFGNPFTYQWIAAETGVFMNADVVIKYASIEAAHIQGVLTSQILKVPGEAWINIAEIDQASIDALTITSFIKSASWNGNINYSPAVDSANPNPVDDYPDSTSASSGSSSTAGFYLDKYHCYFNSDTTFGNGVKINGVLETAFIETGSSLIDEAGQYILNTTTILHGAQRETPDFAQAAWTHGAGIDVDYPGVVFACVGSEFGTDGIGLTKEHRISSTKSNIGITATAVVEHNLSLWFRQRVGVGGAWTPWNFLAESFSPEVDFGPVVVNWGTNFGAITLGIHWQIGMAPISSPLSYGGNFQYDSHIIRHHPDAHTGPNPDVWEVYQSSMELVSWNLTITNF